MIFFSIIIIFHNEEAKLKETLRSLFHLAYPKNEFEVICIDDDSTDKSASIAQSLPTRYFHLKRCGISKARNIGIKKSRGKFVIFLDAHLALKNMNTLKVFNYYFNKYPHITAICGEYKSVHSNDWNFVRDLRRIVLFHKDRKNRFISSDNFTTLSLAICAFRKSSFLKYKFPEGFKNGYGEDTFLQLQMQSENMVFFYTPQIVGFHDANITGYKILQKMLYEIRGCCNIILRIEDTIQVPYLHYFLSYPLLLIISTLLVLLNSAFVPLLFVTIVVECVGALGVFLVSRYSYQKRLITFLYVICKEFIQGVYLPFYILLNIRSYKQLIKIFRIMAVWEFQKYSIPNIFTDVVYLIKQKF